MRKQVVIHQKGPIPRTTTGAPTLFGRKKGVGGGEHKGPPQKTWTLLAYIAGDNNLSDYGISDIREMCSEGSSPETYAAVQIDTLGEFEGSVRYEISEKDWSGQAHRIVIDRLPETDSGSPDTIEDFLSWGFSRYPAAHTLVVVWNHGSGFRTYEPLIPRKNIAYDDFGTSLDMPELEMALQRAMRKSSLEKIDILGFDACLMSMLEVAYQFKDLAHFIVGSQQTEPGEGWPYDKVLREMNALPSPDQFAKSIVRTYMESYAHSANVTQSAIQLNSLDNVKQALNDLAMAMLKSLPTSRKDIRAKRLAVQCYEYADYVDLVHLVNELKDIKGLEQYTQKVVEAVRKAVIENQWRGGRVRNSNGLSIWFPSRRASFMDFRAQYLALKFNAGESEGKSMWLTFLDEFFSGRKVSTHQE